MHAGADSSAANSIVPRLPGKRLGNAKSEKQSLHARILSHFAAVCLALRHQNRAQPQPNGNRPAMSPRPLGEINRLIQHRRNAGRYFSGQRRYGL